MNKLKTKGCQAGDCYMYNVGETDTGICTRCTVLALDLPTALNSILSQLSRKLFIDFEFPSSPEWLNVDRHNYW